MFTTKRIQEVDFLRAISFVMVVLQHAIGAYASRLGIPISESVVLGVLFVTAKFAVPMFVFLSGMSLFYTYSEKLDTIKFLKKRVLSILSPYILWTLFYSCFDDYALISSREWGSIISRISNWEFFSKILHNLLFGVSYYHMWFVVMIFQFYLLFPIMVCLYHKFRQNFSEAFNRKLLTIFNISWFCLLIIKTYVLPNVVLPIQSNFIFQYIMAWSDREFIYYLGYFTLGAQAGVDVNRWRTWIANLSWWNWLGLGVAFSIVSWELFSNLSDNHLNFMVAFTLKPEVAVLCLGEILLFYKLSMAINIDSLWAGVLQLIGKYSFGAYFVHALMLQIICLKFIDKLPFHDYILATIMAVILGSIFSVGLGWAWDRMWRVLKGTYRVNSAKPHQTRV